MRTPQFWGFVFFEYSKVGSCRTCPGSEGIELTISSTPWLELLQQLNVSYTYLKLAAGDRSACVTPSLGAELPHNTSIYLLISTSEDTYRYFYVIRSQSHS